MNEWIPVVVAIGINVAAIATAYGRMTQTIANIKERMGVSDAAKIKSNERTELWENRIEDRSLLHSILPDCMNKFSEISSKLGILTGKIDTLIELNKK